MKLILKTTLMLLAVIAVTFAGCKKDNSDDNNNGTQPAGTMSLTVHGKNWTANFGVAATKNSGQISVTGTGSSSLSCNLTLYNIPGVGTYPISGITPNSNAATWKEGSGEVNTYRASYPKGSGSVTINNLTNTSITGTFQFTGLNSESNQVVITEGKFTAYF